MSWPFAYTPYIWPMLASAAFLSALALYAWRHRSVPAVAPFIANMLFDALWALLTGIEIAATTLEVKVLFFKLEAVAGVGTMTALLWFALEYASLGKWTTRRNVLRLSLASLLCIVLIATDGLHHLLWTRFWFDGFVRMQRGPLNLPFVSYIVLLPTLALFVFLRLALKSTGIYRPQALLLFTGNLLPLLTFGLEAAAINPVVPLDPLILMLNVTAALFAVAIFRFRLFDVVPVGRETAIERMANGVLILDAENRIVDLNPAASHVLALAYRATVGRPAMQALAAYPDLAKLLEQATAASAEITLKGNGQSKCFQAHLSPLTHPTGFHLGRLLLLQDVTEQKRGRELLGEQQRALAALREREYLARELHDDLGQVLGYVKMQAQAARDRLAEDQKGAADEYLAQLIGVAQQAHVDVREYILGAKMTPGGQSGFLLTLGQYLRQFEANFKIRTELQTPPELRDEAFAPMVQAQLLRIVQEALTNARKHARAHCVQVRAECEDGRARVVIQDDGAGFDPAQATAEGQQFGLRFMRERAEEVGGSLAVISSPGWGTQVVVEVPLHL